MADMLALIWPRSAGGALRGATVSSSGAVGPTFEIPGPVTGEGLKAAIAKAGAGAKSAAVALPRSVATVRRLDLPAVPDDDLPDLVRMQAATKSAAPLDQLALDFLPLPGAEEGEGSGRGVLLASVPATLLKEVRAVVGGAGLELASVGLNPGGTARLVAGRGTTAGTTLIVTRDGEFAEFVLLAVGPEGPRVVHTHAAHPTGEDAATWRKSLLSECSRMLVSHADAAPGPVARAWAIGEDADALAAALAERYDCEATGAEDWSALGLTGGAGRSDPGALSGAVGLAIGGPAVPTLDFLAPRRKPEPVDRRLRNGLIAATALALVVGAGWFVLARQKSDLRDALAGLDAQIASDEKFLDRNGPLADEDAALAAWDAEVTDARGELARLDALLPGTDRLFLALFQLAPPTTRSRATVKAEGFAESTGLVREVERDLAARGYVVSPTQTARVTGREGYPVKFELSAEQPPPPGPEEGPPDGGATARTAAATQGAAG